MSNRRQAAAANRIRGPQSALTDFLAAHNISAQQISTEHQRRLREAQEQAAQQAGPEKEEDKENESAVEDEAPEERKKRKRKEEKAIMKIKQSKEFKRRKEFNEEFNDGEDDDAMARGMLKKSQPRPGQFENCEICEKRFTVTAYSKTGAEGGLLCTKCSKELVTEEKKNQLKKSRGGPKGRRRQTESEKMMGNVKPGTKTLLESCVVRVADVIHDIDEFGDLPQNLLDRLSQILSKRRVISSHTLNLFLRPDTDRIAIYDCGKLEEEDFHKIFALMPNIEDVNLRFAGQMKDPVFMYMIEKNHRLKRLELGASNLISDKAWCKLFRKRGPSLESLKMSELNDSLNDETIEEMAAGCKNLRRLKLRKCSHIAEPSILSISKMSKLQHLSLAVGQEASAETLSTLIKRLGPSLQTLSLEDFVEADDSVLAAIRHSCRQISKLRFTGNSVCSDAGFASLFTGWTNPPIPFIDLSGNRDVDNAKPDGPQDTPIGVASEAFKALMKHSGARLERLNLASCRHISYKALSEVFDGHKVYPLLKDIDFSLITVVDAFIMKHVFASCPKLEKLAVFACLKARDAQIPPGIAVIGLSNAQESVVIEGSLTTPLI